MAGGSPEAKNVANSNRFGPLSEARLAEFPGDYRDFLLAHNGGKPEPNDFEIPGQGDSALHHTYGLHDGPEYSRLDRKLRVFASRISPDVLPIADDPCGNQICLGIGGDRRYRVYFWDHEREDDDGTDGHDLVEIAASFSEFLDRLHPDRSEVPPARVVRVWVDPEFLAEQRRKGNARTPKGNH